MRSFALTCVNTEEGTVTSFAIRQAASSSDYLVSLLLAGQGAQTDSLWYGFLSQVVLKHVPCVEASTVSVLSYDVETDSIILVDSNPFRPALVEERKRWRHRGKSAIEFTRLEESIEGRYVVSVARIETNLANAIGDDCVWDMIESDIQAACPRRQVKVPEVIEILDDEDAEDEEVGLPAAKRSRMEEADC